MSCIIHHPSINLYLNEKVSKFLGAPPSPPYSLNMLGTHFSNQILNSRKQREFIPESKKDESYWDRRKRNNEAAKR